ncbi:MAG: Na+/H+ antiporter subunit E [Chlamydiales bacterium]|nr:Na+/H+ antiporter subunit E [Chlamydiia bacterium]MCP5508708.1 Na+/H+ antiporter subunit E [Chlamydiales bacterium]
MSRLYYFFFFLASFLRSFVSANIKLAYLVLFVRKEDLIYEFITIDGSELTNVEALLLSYAITLTPGTITVDITPKKGIIVHVVDNNAQHNTGSKIKGELIPAIQRFTR